MSLPRSLLTSTLLLALCLVAMMPVVAQPAAEELEPVPPERAQVPPERAHPRATMQTFLTAFVENRIDQAVACLDLSQTNLTATLRAARGRELAIQLKDTLDRIALVDINTLPDDPRGPAFVFALPESVWAGSPWRSRLRT